MKGVLLTRPQAQAERTAALIAAEGHFNPVISPLLRIVALPWSFPERIPAAILLTSINASFALSGFARTTSIVAVGKATAEAARRLGFTDVESADGDGMALVGLVKTHLSPAAGGLLHLSGQDVATDLEAELGEAGYQVERKIVYRTEEAHQLPPDIHQKIGAGDIVAALVYSPKTARTLAALLSAGEKARLSLITLSPAITEAAGAGWKACFSAAKPSESDLLKTLFGLADSV